MDEYNYKLCAEKHDNITDKLEEHESRLNKHEEKIVELEKHDKTIDEQIKGLCKELAGLTTTLKWFMGLLVSSFVGFFFFAVQQSVLK